MSTNAKTALWIVIGVVVVGGGIWWWVASHNNGATSAQQMSDMTPQQMQDMSSSTTASSTAMPSGDSDQAIEQDMNSANTQMNGFSSDSASMNQSLNDQPVQQAE